MGLGKSDHVLLVHMGSATCLAMQHKTARAEAAAARATFHQGLEDETGTSRSAPSPKVVDRDTSTVIPELHTSELNNSAGNEKGYAWMLT